MGQPLKIEDLGETQISQDVFQDYLRTQGSDRFRGDRYDLFHHNCNNFSHETAQFLVGRGIPQHIIDLPGEILATPMGQMIAPMLQQMTPQGQSIPFTDNAAASNMQGLATPPPPPATSATPTTVKFPLRDFTAFDQQLKVDGLTRKLEEFNSNQSEEVKLAESELKVVIGIAKGLVRLSDENFAILAKVGKWKKAEVFPLLDILRFKCVRNTFDNKQQVEKVVAMFEENLSSEYQVNSMLSVRGLCNVLKNPEWQQLVSNDIVNKVVSLIPTSHTNLEISIATFLFNMSVLQLTAKDLDTCILVASTIVMTMCQEMTNDESHYRVLAALGNIVSCGLEEVTQFLLSLEVKDVVEKFKKSEHKMVAVCSNEILKAIGVGSNGDSGSTLDLD